MKSKFCLILLFTIFSPLNIYAENEYIATDDCFLFKEAGWENLEKIMEIKKGSILNKKSTSYEILDLKTNEGVSSYYELVEFNGKEGFIKAEYLKLNNSELIELDLITTSEKNFCYVKDFTFDVLKNKDISIAKKFLNKTIDDYINNMDDYSLPWKNYLNVSDGLFYQTFICFANGYVLKNQWNITKTKKINSSKYILNVICIDFRDFDSPLPEELWPKKGEKHILYLEIDGDYISFYLDSMKNYICRYAKITNQTIAELDSLIYNASIDLSKVTWPRHADGSCDYDGSSKKVTAADTSQSKTSEATKAVSNTNVAVNKTMSTNCNLKLRSGEATSTQVLTVMAAGTKVKILELGKAETIDGISSNWVRIEVQKNAKDRDGKEIKAGTVGWCYGGYLE